MLTRPIQRTGAILLVILAGALLLAAILIVPSMTQASSHREAPLISKDPFADNTDTYVFIPPGQTDNIVLVANWIPFEGPEGGPNYWEWDDHAYYDIHVDIDGDAVSEVTYTLRSDYQIREPLNTFLYNTGPIDTLDDLDWNRPQTYSVTEQFEPGAEPGSSGTNVLVSDVYAPPANIGNKSTGDYASLAQDAIYTYDDADTGDEITIFAGQADDSFWVDLQVFDLLTLRGQDPPIGYFEGTNIPVDSVSGFNVHTLVLEIPIDRLVRDGEPVLGVWAATRRPAMRVLTGPGQDHTGAPVQISRLGMPLVNEVVIPMGLKDTFNAIPPSVDLSVYTVLQESVENPEVGTLLCALYGVPLPDDSDDDCNTEYVPGAPRTGRGDIFDIFLQGMVLENEFVINTAGGPTTLPAGFNVNRPDGVVPAEMIRINTGISGTLCSPTPSRLGVLGGDACGFPNGRRLADDIVEIELLAVAGAAYEVLDDSDASFSFNPDLIGVLDDNVDGNDVPFQDNFPYVAMAQSGQTHWHENPIFFYIFPFIQYGEAAATTVSETISENPAQSAAAVGGTILLLGPGMVWWRRRKSQRNRS